MPNPNQLQRYCHELFKNNRSTKHFFGGKYLFHLVRRNDHSDYFWGKQIAKGGFGNVYKVARVDPKSGQIDQSRYYALKKIALNPPGAYQDEAKSLFYNDQLVAHYINDKNGFLLMPYFDSYNLYGTNLHGQITHANFKALNFTELTRLAVALTQENQMAINNTPLHGNGLLNLDIAGRNIRFDIEQHGSAKIPKAVLVDWGLAIRKDSNKDESTLTAMSMAPEMLDNKHSDKTSTFLWAGVFLYLFGQPNPYKDRAALLTELLNNLWSGTPVHSPTLREHQANTALNSDQLFNGIEIPIISNVKIEDILSRFLERMADLNDERRPDSMEVSCFFTTLHKLSLLHDEGNNNAEQYPCLAKLLMLDSKVPYDTLQQIDFFNHSPLCQSLVNGTKANNQHITNEMTAVKNAILAFHKELALLFGKNYQKRIKDGFSTSSTNPFTSAELQEFKQSITSTIASLPKSLFALSFREYLTSYQVKLTTINNPPIYINRGTLFNNTNKSEIREENNPTLQPSRPCCA